MCNVYFSTFVSFASCLVSFTLTAFLISLKVSFNCSQLKLSAKTYEIPVLVNTRVEASVKGAHCVKQCMSTAKSTS